MTFVHLHTHSEYSLLDGACRIEALVAAARNAGMPALAITDHGVMYGAISFYRAAESAGIKGIIGCEVYVAPRSRFDKDFKIDDEFYHLTLLAKDFQGYKNLMKLVTEGSLTGFYYRPRVDKELLTQFSTGLIALSGCIAGRIPRLILNGRYQEAKDLALEYNEIFKDSFYLEIQDHGMLEEKQVTQGLIKISKETLIPLVATNDVHYIRREDSVIHDVLLAIQTGKTIDDPKRLKFPTDQFYLKDAREMAILFDYVPEALTNTLRIADECHYNFEFGEHHFPEFKVPKGYSTHKFLVRLCEDGLIQRYGTPSNEAKARLEYELSIIEHMGFSSYFLIVQDFVNMAYQRGIPVGPGRGSAVGSLVAYVLGITNIDPLAHNLIFERFLNPERLGMPDIDIDFAPEGRDEIIRYVLEKYGSDHVAQIITFGTMAAKAAIRDVGRALNVPISQVDMIAKALPSGISLTDEKLLYKVPGLQEVLDKNENLEELVRVAATLEGLPRHSSTHASGVVISPEPLVEFTPLQRSNDGGVSITQYSMNELEDIGLLKMDFLGVEELSVIDHAVRIIKKTKGIKLDLNKLSLDDSKTYELLCRGDTAGVFQLSSELGKRTLREVKPRVFGDIVATVALVRPGPASMAPEYVKRKNFGAEIEYSHPSLKPILEETYGIMLYQEQVMQVASALAGFTLAEADHLRRGMAKKDPEALTAMRERFLKGCKERGLEETMASDIFDSMEYFSGYGFNKSHAAAYAQIAYESAYLRANYPTEFMAAVLTREKNNFDKLSMYIEDCRQGGFEIFGPDVNESIGDFTVMGDKKIRFGLGAIKNVGSNAVRAIIIARQDGGPFTSLFNFCERVDMGQVNKKALENLIRAGALDSIGGNRAQLLSTYEAAADRGARIQRNKLTGRISLFDMVVKDEGVGKVEPKLPNIPEFSTRELLEMERELLGFYVSGHPMEDIQGILKELISSNIIGLRNYEDGANVVIGGIIRNIRQLSTKTGNLMSILNIEDESGNVEVIMFPNVHKKFFMYIKTHEVFIAIGKLEVRENFIKVIAESVVPIKDGVLILRTPDSNGREVKVLQGLKSILEKYPGQVPLFLRVDTKERGILILASPEIWASPNEGLNKEVKALLGYNALTYIPLRSQSN